MGGAAFLPRFPCEASHSVSSQALRSLLAVVVVVAVPSQAASFSIRPDATESDRAKSTEVTKPTLISLPALHRFWLRVTLPAAPVVRAVQNAESAGVPAEDFVAARYTARSAGPTTRLSRLAGFSPPQPRTADIRLNTSPSPLQMSEAVAQATAGPSASSDRPDKPNESRHRGRGGHRGRGRGRGRGVGGKDSNGARLRTAAEGTVQVYSDAVEHGHRLDGGAPPFRPAEGPSSKADGASGRGGGRGRARQGRGGRGRGGRHPGLSNGVVEAQDPSPDGADLPPKQTSRRRQNFGGKLTTDESDTLVPSQIAASHSTLVSIDTSNMTLSARIAHEISTTAYDCPICYSSLGPNSSIAPCPSCHAVFHLSCLSEWATRSVDSTAERARLLRDRDGVSISGEEIRGVWRCPGCQGRHVGPETVPKKYTCWCGKLDRPCKKRPPPSTRVPHSCGQPCGRLRSRHGPDDVEDDGSSELCPHPCAVECHPGACPPCPVVVSRLCHCGKTRKSGRCSQIYPMLTAALALVSTSTDPTDAADAVARGNTFLSCNQLCGKPLGCEGGHVCDRTCHAGPCGACEVVKDKTCYCGRMTKFEQLCGQPVRGDDVHSSGPGVDGCRQPQTGSVSWKGEFACSETTECPWPFDCGIHLCDTIVTKDQPACHSHTVHPTASSLGRCPLDPANIHTCPCGKTPLSPLDTTPPRSSCTDPIPTCASTCGKPLPSCGHPCPTVCHEGPCGPCTQSITTHCRCGYERVVRPCADVTRLRLSAGEEAVEVRCERVCRALRRCGKHVCARRCCPLSFLEGVNAAAGKKTSGAIRAAEEEAEDPSGLHVCDRVCAKKLSCGLHECELPDHRGKCPPCLRASFEEIACHCGCVCVSFSLEVLAPHTALPVPRF